MYKPALFSGYRQLKC